MWLLAKLGVQSPSSPVTGSNCQCNVEVSAPEANSVAALLGDEVTLCKDPLLLLTLCHHSEPSSPGVARKGAVQLSRL